MKTLLANGNLLTMEREGIRYRTDLTVENGVITALGKGLDETGCTVVDCTGRYILPGLFDAHLHVGSSDMLPMLLACGITAVRHLSGGQKVMALAEDIAAGRRQGPYIYASGFVYDGKGGPGENKNHIYIETEAEAEQAVTDTIEGGYLWVKTYPSMQPPIYKRLMDTANACGIKVCGHMGYHVEAKALRDWGYHCCEHSSSMPRHPWDIRYVAESGMWLCPTQVVCETLPDYVWNGKQLEDLPQWGNVPRYMQEKWKRQNIKIAQGYKNRNLRPDINQVIARGRAFMEHSNRYMAGSDTAYPGIIAGFSLHDELEKLVTLYGCTPYEALRAATASPAEYIGLTGRKGVLAAGADADLLILRENPLQAITNTRTIETVIQAGRALERPQLDAMLDEASALEACQTEFFEAVFEE